VLPGLISFGPELCGHLLFGRHVRFQIGDQCLGPFCASHGCGAFGIRLGQLRQRTFGQGSGHVGALLGPVGPTSLVLGLLSEGADFPIFGRDRRRKGRRRRIV
jgi:hypothetical protein